MLLHVRKTKKKGATERDDGWVFMPAMLAEWV